MRIRFKVGQAESFRRGINAPEPVVSLEVDPSLLPKDQRELIGRHLLGVDVVYDPTRAMDEFAAVPIGGHPPGDLVESKDPRLDSLLIALMELGPQTDRVIQPLQFGPRPATAPRVGSG